MRINPYLKSQRQAPANVRINKLTAVTNPVSGNEANSDQLLGAANK